MTDNLTLAVMRNDVTAAEELLQCGAQISEKNEKMQSMLRIAVCQGYAEMTMLLIEHGADVNEKDWSGAPLLVEAVSKGYHEIAALLLDNKADINAIDGDNWTALHYCALDEKFKHLMRLLISKGANPGLRTKNGETAADIAKRKKHRDLQKILKDAPSAYCRYLAAEAGKVSHNISAHSQVQITSKATPYKIKRRVQL